MTIYHKVYKLKRQRKVAGAEHKMDGQLNLKFDHKSFVFKTTDWGKNANHKMIKIPSLQHKAT